MKRRKPMKKMQKAASLLKKLSLREVNAGACFGAKNWIDDPKDSEIVSFNPGRS
jgi:hypothetical protein